MKFRIALLVLVALPVALAIFAADIDIALHKFEEDCSKESGFSPAEVEVIRRHKPVPDIESANQWAKCMMQKHNVIKSDGTVSTRIEDIRIPEDTGTLLEAFPICSVLVGRDIADTARLMMNCYRSNSQGLVMSFRKRT